MRVRAKTEIGKMAISRGGATEAAITRTESLFMYFLH